MAQVGNFGKSIVFKVSDSYVFTPNNFTKKVSGKWNTHDIMLKKPKPEFNGADQGEITYKIILDAVLGVRPRTVLETLENMVEKGTADILVIGGRQVGKNEWVITSMSETWDVVYNGGELVQATCSITMKEYT